MTQQFYFQGVTIQKKNLGQHKDLHTNIHSHIIHSTQMSIKTGE